MTRRAERKNIKKLRQGHRDAAEALICQHYRSIYRLLAYLTRDAGFAEDLTQETFAAAWAGIGSYKARASFKTWLHRIAYHKFIDARRQARRNAALMEKLKNEKTNAHEPQDPLHRLTTDEHWNILHETMAKLPSSDYTIIVLHYVQGLSLRQVADVIDQPVGTVKWKVSKALKKLKDYLTDRVQP